MSPRITLFMCALGLILGLSVPARGADAPASAAAERHLLVLHSYHQAAWTEALLAGMHEALDGHPGLTWSIEYMDTKRLDTPAYLDQLQALYAMKYRDQRWDVIITTDDNAFDFALERRPHLFGTTPVVFCGVNRYRPEDLAGQTKVTGVVEQLDIAKTLALARRCRPRAGRIWVIGDDTETCRVNRAELAQILVATGSSLDIVDLQGLSLTELDHRLATAAPTDFAFFLAYWHDDVGHAVAPDQLGAIFGRSAVPIFGRSEWMIGLHQVGGLCVSGRAQGAAAGRLARRILDGEAADAIGVITDSPNVWMFDYQDLRRHGIAEDLLPSGSTVIGRPAASYAVSKPLFWVSLAVLGILVTLTILLAVTSLRHRQALRSQARSETRYRRIADNCWEFICELDENCIYQYCNAAYRQLGYDPEALVGTSPVTVLHPDDTDQVMEQLRELDPERSRLDLTYRAFDAKGTLRWFESTVTAYPNEEGRLRYTAISRDITDRLLAQEDRERFFATSIDPLCIADFDGRFKQVNPAWTRLLGWSERELLAIPWLDLVHEDDRAATIVASESLRAGETVIAFENRYRCKDGSYRWLAWNSHPLVEEGRIFATVQDITERKRVDEALAESERRFRNIVRSSPMGIHLYELCGDELVLIDANAAADRAIGVDHQDLIGQTITNAFPNLTGTEVPQRYLEAARDGRSWQTTSLHYEDEHIAGAFDVYAFQTSPGRMAVLFSEITDRLRAEEDLRESREQFMQAQKMEAVGQLAGGVAHDFNNMLGGILGAAELLAPTLATDAAATALVKTIVQAAERAAELTRQLLSYSRRGRMITTAVDVHAVIGDALSILRHSLDRRIEVVEHLEAQRHTITGDPAQIQSAVLNLGINARDAMPDGGILTVSTRNLHDAAVTTEGSTALLAKDCLELVVADTGSGMSPAIIKRIFEPFFTTKDVGAGTGLGLAAVYGTIQSHGGRIDVTSDPGAGSVFSILLPTTTTLPASEATTIPVRTHRGSGTVLVIDDEPLLRMTLQTMLQHMGYTVLLAEDGQEGLEIYTRQQDRIDLVILDMIMPRLGGRECFARLKELNPVVRVVIATGYTDTHADADRDLLRHGPVTFLRKPFTNAVLSRVLDAVFSG